uniref:Neogenin C-terminal domain-containing protein n=1 Tax=Sinocyclocheilus rhinocerous TaxID=307959 RepID=A0A673J886_9TELE
MHTVAANVGRSKSLTYKVAFHLECCLSRDAVYVGRIQQISSLTHCVCSVRNQAPAPEPLVAPSQPCTTAELQKTEALIKEEEPPSMNPPTAHVRPTHPLKSFAVPTVTVSAHNPPTYETALPSTPLLAQPGLFPVPGVKTASIGTLNRARALMAVTVPSAPDQSETSTMLDTVSTYETDELSEEMAHLEGLMKDLNAITTD